MKITVNGKTLQTENIALTDLISEYRINPNNCIVELNGELLDKDRYNNTDLREGDRLELIRFIGGG